MNTTEPVRVGVDVGGTKIIAAVVDSDGRVGPVSAAATPSPRAGVGALDEALESVVEQARAGRELAAVGLALAGFVDADQERVMFAPHLAWRRDPVRARLAQRWGTQVWLENDATCAGLAEARYGAAHGAASAVVITVGTGIGGAILFGGRAWRGANGMAGEFGHQRVVPHGRPCPCGLAGCWEQYVSGRALARAARERGSALEGPALTAAAHDGDVAAQAAFAEVGGWLGVGLAGVVAALDPDVIVVGGGAAEAGDLLFAPAREALEASLVGGGHRQVPPVVPAALGPRAGLIGATLLGQTW